MHASSRLQFKKGSKLLQLLLQLSLLFLRVLLFVVVLLQQIPFVHLLLQVLPLLQQATKTWSLATALAAEYLCVYPLCCLSRCH